MILNLTTFVASLTLPTPPSISSGRTEACPVISVPRPQIIPTGKNAIIQQCFICEFTLNLNRTDYGHYMLAAAIDGDMFGSESIFAELLSQEYPIGMSAFDFCIEFFLAQYGEESVLYVWVRNLSLQIVK